MRRQAERARRVRHAGRRMVEPGYALDAPARFGQTFPNALAAALTGLLLPSALTPLRAHPLVPPLRRREAIADDDHESRKPEQRRPPEDGQAGEPAAARLPWHRQQVTLPRWVAGRNAVCGALSRPSARMRLLDTAVQCQYLPPPLGVLPKHRPQARCAPTGGGLG